MRSHSKADTRGSGERSDVRRRVEALRTSLPDEETLSPAAVQEMLASRARALARSTTIESQGDAIEVVTFALATERYAVESRFVMEVCQLTDLALLPGAAAPAIGVTAWRGGLLTVLDLRPLLGVPADALNDLGRVIVLGEGRAAFGILADAVLTVIHLRVSEVREPAERASPKRDFVRGTTGEALILLDAGKLLRFHL